MSYISMNTSYIDKFLKSYKSLGLGNTFIYILKKFFKRFSRNKIRIYKYLIYIQSVPDLIIDNKKTNFSFEILKGYNSIVKNFPRSLKTINFRFNQNGICIVVKKNNEFAGYIWLNKNFYIEDEVRCLYFLYPVGLVCWDYDVYIQPKYRFSAAFKRLWEQAFRYQQKKGIKYSISRIDAFNLNSKIVHERLGAVSIGYIFFVMIGSIQVSISNFKPYIGVNFFKNSYFNVHINSDLSVRRLI